MEYDANTLAMEYARDVSKGMDPKVPEHYFPGDDPGREPLCTWRSTANLIFANWLNYYVYQMTEYDADRIGEERWRSRNRRGHTRSPPSAAARCSYPDRCRSIPSPV